VKLHGIIDGREQEIEIEPTEGGYMVTVDGTTHEVDCANLEASFYSLIIDGKSYEISVREGAVPDEYAVRHGGHLRTVHIVDPMAAIAGAHLVQTGTITVKAIMPGRVVKVLVEEGDEVDEGQGLIVLEAMKMENEVGAPRRGRIQSVAVQAGQTMETGDTIAVIE
jgi:biotin carboxyl carrier protein